MTKDAYIITGQMDAINAVKFGSWETSDLMRFVLFILIALLVSDHGSGTGGYGDDTTLRIGHVSKQAARRWPWPRQAHCWSMTDKQGCQERHLNVNECGDLSWKRCVALRLETSVLKDVMIGRLNNCPRLDN